MADQKLNIIFTGDVSQLNKAVESSISELAKFEQKLKDSLGVEAFAGINQSIDGLRQKLASLQAIDIKANPEELFSAVREVSAELGKLKDSEVLLTLDDGKVLSQIHNVDKLISDLSASIKIDANVKTEIDRIKSQLSGLTVKIGADATVADAAIKNIQAKLSLLQDERFILSADGEQAESVINEIFSDLQKLKDAKVLINADGSQAEAVIDKIQSELQTSLKGNVTIDTAGIQRKLQELSSVTGEIRLGADTSEIDVAVKSIREKLLSFQSIDIQADPQQALTAINEILKEIAKVKSSELILSSDNADVLADINQIQTRLQDVKTNIRISADLDTKNLEALLKPLSTQVSVDVNTKAAEAELKALLQQVKNLKGQDILINLDGTQVVKTIDAIERELLQLQAKLKAATNPADIARLTQQLQLFKNSLSASGANQFSSNLNKAQNATFAFSQVLREAPAFAFSFQTGILALSNNLPILADRLKEARAAGASFGQIAGGIAKSLFSLPGILTIASTALIFLSGNLKSARTDVEKFNDAIAEDSSKGIANLELIRQKLTDLNIPTSKRIELAKTYNETADKSNQIDLQQINNINAANTAIDKQIKLLLERAKARAAESLLAEKFEKLFKQQAEFELKFPQFQTTELDKRFDDLQKQINNRAKQLGIKEVLDKTDIKELLAFIDVDEATVRNLSKNSEKLKLVLDSIGKESLRVSGTIIKRIEEARQGIGEGVAGVGRRVQDIEITKNEINDILAQFGKSIDISGLIDFNKGLKDVSDDIVSRARAFVKQFGDIFVVPDLTESFTNTKELIQKAAVKLLDDVAKLNLKIKLPVQVITDTDFLQPELLIDPNFKIDEKLRENILKQIQAELKPIDATIDVNITPNLISKEQTKQIDDLVKQFFDLGDRGVEALRKIDFTNVNKGIADGLKALQRLNEELAITEEVSLAVGNSFASVFNAIFENEDPIRAFFRSIISELQRLIAKLIATKIAAGFLNLAFPGLKSIGQLTSIGLGGQANFGLGGGGGSLRALSVNVSGSVIQRGTDTVISFTNSSRSLGRIQ